MNRIPIIGVMGSRDQEHPELTVPLGQMIARKGFHLLTGGGIGVMLKVSEAFCSVPKSERKGMCIGIVPTSEKPPGHFIMKKNYPNPYVEIPIITPLPTSDRQKPDQINRNHVNILTSDAVIALPGGTGTRNEIMLAVKFGNPLILFDPENRLKDVSPQAPRACALADIEQFLKS